MADKQPLKQTFAEKALGFTALAALAVIGTSYAVTEKLTGRNITQRVGF